MAVALALRPAMGSGTLERAAFSALVATEALAVVYWATIGRALTRYRSHIVAAASIGELDALIDRTIKRLMQLKTMKQMHGQLEPKLIDVSATRNLPAPGGTESPSSE